MPLGCILGILLLRRRLQRKGSQTHLYLDYVQDGEKGLKAEKAWQEKGARREVLWFKEECKIDGNTGEDILQDLLVMRKNGKGSSQLCASAFPMDLAMWGRKENCHPVVWHMQNFEYQFASELHAKVAEETFQS